MSRDIPHEARLLVKRMYADPMVNVTEQWKVRHFGMVMCMYMLLQLNSWMHSEFTSDGCKSA